MTAAQMSPPRRARAGHLGALKFLSVARSHVGCVRTHNEDNLLDRPDIGLWAVADGMGGHADGAAASALVISELESVDAFSSAYGYRDAVCSALHRANAQLRARSAGDIRGPSGSTVVALLAHQGHYACIWAGDSRAYKLRAGILKRVTRDHSVVQELLDSGALRPAEAQGHAQSSVITRAVGADDMMALDSVYGKIERGDRLLLCSDGLTGVIDDRELARFMAKSPLQTAADGLIALALARGARDNVTVIIIAAESA